MESELDFENGIANGYKLAFTNLKKNTDLGPHRPGSFSSSRSLVRILGD